MRILLQIILLCGLATGPAVMNSAYALSFDDLKKDLKSAKDKVKRKVKQGKAKFDKSRGKLSEAEEIEIGGKLVAGLLGAARWSTMPACSAMSTMSASGLHRRPIASSCPGVSG